MFNIHKAIKNSGLSKAKVLQLQNEIKKDYPNDPLLYELHLIRALKSSVTKINNQKHRLVARN